MKNCSEMDRSSRIFRLLQILSSLDLAFDVVTLAEEGVPVVQHLLVLVRQIVPVRTALLRLE